MLEAFILRASRERYKRPRRGVLGSFPVRGHSQLAHSLLVITSVINSAGLTGSGRSALPCRLLENLSHCPRFRHQCFLRVVPFHTV